MTQRQQSALRNSIETGKPLKFHHLVLNRTANCYCDLLTLSVIWAYNAGITVIAYLPWVYFSCPDAIIKF